ncbi:MAG TPA: hypothetical protein VFO10_02605 [Oligoflexus sp.]|uniref:hypothetical protein n=1 Tax=Oligoflexus sp. TaxID=1971216 RepID=UPI002D7E9790|nr:hypothetical protein [Oligoflexus sp.]HET9236112.1 hypothetical protein [Oligoflexus sp.]
MHFLFPRLPLAFGLLILLVPAACDKEASREKPLQPPTRVEETKPAPPPSNGPKKPIPMIPTVEPKPREPAKPSVEPDLSAPAPTESVEVLERKWELKQPKLTVKDIEALSLPPVTLSWADRFEGVAQLRQELIKYYSQQWTSNQSDLNALQANLDTSYENFKKASATSSMERHEAASAKLWNERLDILRKEYKRVTDTFEKRVEKAQGSFKSECESSLRSIAASLSRSMNKNSELPTESNDPNYYLTETLSGIKLSFQCDRDLMAEFYPTYRTEKADLERQLKLETGPLISIQAAYQEAVQRLKGDETKALELAAGVAQSTTFEKRPLDRNQLDAAALSTVTLLVDNMLDRWYKRFQCGDAAHAEDCKKRLTVINDKLAKRQASLQDRGFFSNRVLTADWIRNQVVGDFEAMYERTSYLLKKPSMMDWALFRLWDHSISSQEKPGNRFMSSMIIISSRMLDSSVDSNPLNLTSSTNLLDSRISEVSLVEYIDNMGKYLAVAGWKRSTFPVMAGDYGYLLQNAADTSERLKIIQDFQAEAQKNLADWDEERAFIRELIQNVPYMQDLKNVWERLSPAAVREIKLFTASEELRVREQNLVDSIQLTGIALSLPLVADGQLNSRHLFVSNWLNDLKVDLDLLLGTLFDPL